MEQTLSQMIARATGAAFTATSRPALTFFLCQLAIALSLRHGWLAMDPSMLWLVSLPMLGAGLVATVAEVVVEHSDQIEEVMRNVHGDKVWRIVGSFFVGLLMISIGELAAAETVIPVATGSMEVLRTSAGVRETGQPVWVDAVVVAGSIGLTQGLTWLRAMVLGWLDDLHLKKVWQYVETGGVIGLLIVLAVSPMLTVVLALVVSLVMAVVALVVRAADKVLDESRRRPCPACGVRVRQEALLCWKCKTDLEPARWLAPESSAGTFTRIRETMAEWMAARRVEPAE
jgi:hypothetical protein